MKTLIALPAIAGLLFAAAIPAVAAAQTRTSPAAETAKPAVKTSYTDEKVCKTEEVTGSRLGGHRVCMTRGQWEAQAADAARGVDNFQQSSGHLVPMSH
ncbi:MAG: hypothetical protein ABI376_08380 [Caulobacteraceae bacterium]